LLNQFYAFPDLLRQRFLGRRPVRRRIAVAGGAEILFQRL
jgi:hypothetical protein